MILSHKDHPTPVGALRLVATPDALVAVLWEDDRPTRVKLGETITADDHPILTRAAAQLDEYFAGRRVTFDLPLAPAGTPFQQKVWQALTRIPFGLTASYRDLAVSVGSPDACRAVGAANGRNPLSIVVPCHRVIGATGKLTGFAGGLDAKRFLLNLESASTTPAVPRSPSPL
jgi:methylated-DNA-[protein]-cysteine S-methyltransferase